MPVNPLPFKSDARRLVQTASLLKWHVQTFFTTLRYVNIAMEHVSFIYRIPTSKHYFQQQYWISSLEGILLKQWDMFKT